MMSSDKASNLQNCCQLVAGVPDTVLATLGAALIVSIFGVIGYWVKAHFDRKAQKELFDRDNRRQIYETFLMSFISAINSAPGSEEGNLAGRSYVESRMKIILHGSEGLMNALNELSRFHGQDTPDAWNAFRNVALRMRDDFDLKIDTEVEKFSQTLFAPPEKQNGKKAR